MSFIDAVTFPSSVAFLTWATLYIPPPSFPAFPDDPPMTASEVAPAPPNHHQHHTSGGSSSSRGYVYSSRLRPEVPERRSTRLMNNDERERAMLNNYFSALLSEGSESESDEEYSPREEWKKV